MAVVTLCYLMCFAEYESLILVAIVSIVFDCFKWSWVSAIHFSLTDLKEVTAYTKEWLSFKPNDNAYLLLEKKSWRVGSFASPHLMLDEEICLNKKRL